MTHAVDKNINAIPPSVRQILHAPQPALADAIRSSVSQICARHLTKLRSEMPSAQSLDDDALRDDLDVMLDALAETYVNKDGLARLALIGPAHATAREGQQFPIDEVIHEHVLLRGTLRECLRQQLGRELSPREQQALDAGVDVILARTVKSFAAQREARLRFESNALAQFLASMSHDVRNELNGAMTSMHGVVDTASELRPHLAKSGADPARLSQFEELLREVDECRHAINSTINAMSRLLEAERLRKNVTASPRAVALSKLLDGAVRSAARMDRGDRPDVSHAVQRIKVKCPDELQLWTDPDVLGTILVNLIGNAVKYAPNGEIEVVARLASDDSCELTITDHGPGLPQEQVQALFGEFQRGEHPEAIEGVGLGLFIATRAAELLGARLDAKSAPGEGSQFRLVLPPSATLPPTSSAATLPPSSSPPSTHPENRS